MIVVTGATGQLGRLIVEQLLARLPSSRVGVSVRDPGKAADLGARGVRVRHGDFSNAASLQSAFEGATQVLLVSSNARATGGDTLAQHRTAIAAARAAGAERVVYTSHMGVSDRSAFAPMHDHHATEAMLQESGMSWVALRNGFYAASSLALLGNAVQTGTLEAPADGKVSWTAHADLAEAAALLLTQAGGEDGPTAPLTASCALDLSDIAALLAELTGRPVQRRVVEDEVLAAQLAARGLPARAAATVLGLYRASREGEFAAVDPTLGRLLGRAPTSLRALLEAKLAR